MESMRRSGQVSNYTHPHFQCSKKLSRFTNEFLLMKRFSFFGAVKLEIWCEPDPRWKTQWRALQSRTPLWRLSSRNLCPGENQTPVSLIFSKFGSDIFDVTFHNIRNNFKISMHFYIFLPQLVYYQLR